MPRTRPILRWLTTAATALLLALYVLSVPFYAGSSLGPHINWRLEHARLKMRWTPAAHPESFWIDFNSEGLRWAPDCHFYAKNDWFIMVPLWAFLIAAAAPTAALWHDWRRTRKPPGHCKRCGYDRRALPAGAPCPECGSGKPPRPVKTPPPLRT